MNKDEESDHIHDWRKTAESMFIVVEECSICKQTRTGGGAQ